MKKKLICTFALMFVLMTGCGKENANTEPPAKTEQLVNERTDTSDDATDTDATETDAPTFAYSDGLDEKGYWKNVKAIDLVEMFDYGAIPVPGDVHEVSDSALQAEIDNLLISYSGENQVKDREVADGDRVNIDYVGSIDGVPFDGGSTGGAGTIVTAGSLDYIDDFLIQIIGHTPGETIDVEVTFPDNYHAAELQGKDAVFVTTINYISENVTPELNDAFVKENFSETRDWSTVDDLKDAFKKAIQEQAVYGYVQKYLVEEVTVTSIPESLIEYQKNSVIFSFEDYAYNYGIEVEELLKEEGVGSFDEFFEKNEDIINQSAAFGIVTQAIAEDLKLSIGNDDLALFFLENTGSPDYSQYEELYGLPYLKNDMLKQRVINHIVENAVLK